MRIRLSAVLQLFDGYRRRAIRASEASFLVGGVSVRPIYKPNGYFVFPNLPAGPTRIDILSSMFLPEIVEIDVSEQEGVYSTVHKILSPGRAYPFGGALTSVRGRIVNSSSPVPHTKVRFSVPGGKELLKVAQDDLKSGATEIKLFSSQQTWRLPLPGMFLIADKDKKKTETCFITGAPDSNNVFPLSEPLGFAHSRGTALVELIEFSSAADGTFFMAVPERFDIAQSIDLEVPSYGKVFKIDAAKGKETNTGDLVVRS